MKTVQLLVLVTGCFKCVCTVIFKYIYLHIYRYIYISVYVYRTKEDSFNCLNFISVIVIKPSDQQRGIGFIGFVYWVHNSRLQCIFVGQCSPMESHGAHKPHLMAGPSPAVDDHLYKVKSVILLAAFFCCCCYHNALSGHLKNPYRSFAYITYYGFQFYVFMAFLCVQMYVPLCLYVFLVTFL